MDVGVSVNTTEHISTAAVETCNIQRPRNERMLWLNEIFKTESDHGIYI